MRTIRNGTILHDYIYFYAICFYFRFPMWTYESFPHVDGSQE
jgi:hypothetical protein